MKNVLLVGIEGVYNYGCEAIVRGTTEILKKYDKDVKVSYASYNYQDDVKRLSGCDVNVIERKHCSRWSIRNIIRKLLSFVNIKYRIPFDDVSLFKNFDTVFSIGGDMYTLYSNGDYNKELPAFLEKGKAQGVKYVLWGASVGKFEKNPCALKFYKDHLRKIDALIVREEVTFEYLKSLGLDDTIYLAPDPAFFVPSEEYEKPINNRPLVGINLSPHSALYEYGNIEEGIKRQVRAIVGIIEKMQCDILLLPHVYSRDVNDDDRQYLLNIKKALPEKYRCNVSIIDTDPGFVGLRRYLSKCDYVIAARMHCAVNSVCTGVPTLFVSYSEKAKGMAKYIYGNDSALLSLADFENTQLVVDKLNNIQLTESMLREIRSFDFKNIFSKIS